MSAHQLAPAAAARAARLGRLRAHLSSRTDDQLQELYRELAEELERRRDARHAESIAAERRRLREERST